MNDNILQTIEQKLQRILETKTGFKNLITEKGGIITETTTFHEYIDEARKLMEGGKVVVEEASATAVPNEGHVDKIYFNTNLTSEEVDKIITDANLPWVDANGMQCYFAISMTDGSGLSIVKASMFDPSLEGHYSFLSVFNDNTTNMQCYLSTAAYPFADMILGMEPEEAGYDEKGWCTHNGQWNGESFPQADLTSDMSGYPVGTHNEALKQIFSTTPFDGEPFYKELKGTYEPVTVEVTENGETDLTSYMDNGEMPIKVNVEVASEPVIIESDGSIPIPNNELVTELAFNTSLSPEEVDTIITNANLEYITDNGAPTYYAFYNSTLRLSQSNTGIILCVKEFGIASGLDKPAYMIALLYSDGSLFSFIYVSEGTNNAQLNFTGWNTSYLEGKRFNFNVMAESTYNNTSVGLQNDKLVKVFYALGGEPFRKELTGTYEPVTVEVTENSEIDLTTYMDNGEMPIKINVNVEGSGETGTAITVSSSTDMDALLVEENVGKIYKFVGVTDEKYTNGQYYIIEEV